MSDRRRHSHRKQGDSSEREGRVRSFLGANLVEILGVIAIALGAFLVLERMSIRATLLRWGMLSGASVLHALGHVNESVGNLVARLQFSDVVGLAFIAVALIVIALRARWRLERSPSLTTLQCPRCGGGIYRIHRRFLDRLVSNMVPVRRYRCFDAECRWSGLRVVASSQSREATAAPRPPAAPSST
jgi:hypothetical protein